MPHLIYHHLVSHQLHYTAISEVYISRALRAFGLSMIGIFIPIYLYQSGYSIAVVALFFAVANVTRLVVLPVTGVLLARLGVKRVLILGQLPAVLYILLLTVADAHIGYFLLTAVMLGVELGLFWSAHHFELSHARTKEKTSRQIGVVFMLLSVAQALGPLIGGIIATQFGIHYAFMVAVFLLVAAAYAFTRSPDQASNARFNWRDSFRGWKWMQKDIVANAANGFQSDAAVFIWPLFIFLFLGTYEKVGVVVSLSLATAIVAIYFIARRGDQGKNWQQLHLGSKSAALVHLSRPFAQTLGTATGVNVIHEVASYLYKIPFMSYYYEHASGAPNRIAYITRMEVGVAIGVMVHWTSVAVLSLLFPLQIALVLVFVCAGAAVLFNTKIAAGPQTTVSEAA